MKHQLKRIVRIRKGEHNLMFIVNRVESLGFPLEAFYLKRREQEENRVEIELQGKGWQAYVREIGVNPEAYYTYVSSIDEQFIEPVSAVYNSRV